MTDKTHYQMINSNQDIAVVDKDNNVSMYCYTACDNDSPDEVKNCRGVVYDNTTHDIVCKALPYSNTYNASNYKFDEIDFDNSTIFDSIEGTLIRVFHYKNKWYKTTHHKLNANSSYWSSKTSFGEMFDNAVGDLGTLYDRLDKSNIYMFMVENNNENRIVCDANNNPSVFHVCTMNDGKISFEDNIGIKKPNRCNVTNAHDLRKYVENINIYQNQGVIIFNNDGTQDKVYNDIYDDLMNVRGNEQSIRFRYLQLRNDYDKRNKLCELYPSYEDDFNRYETMITTCARYIYNAYVTRFIRKNFKRVQKDEFSVIRKVHNWHLQDRRSNQVSYEKVIETLNTFTPVFLNRIVKKLIRNNGNYEMIDNKLAQEQDTRQKIQHLYTDEHSSSAGVE